MLFVGADHNGYHLKEYLKAALQKRGIAVVDCGAAQREAHDDYPAIAKRVARSVRAAPRSYGLLLCGSGNGMVMAANRFVGIRAALAPSPVYARKAREDEDANVLVLPAWWMSRPLALRTVRTWLSTSFSAAPRHRRRIRQLHFHA